MRAFFAAFLVVSGCWAAPVHHADFAPSYVEVAPPLERYPTTAYLVAPEARTLPAHIQGLGWAPDRVAEVPLDGAPFLRALWAVFDEVRVLSADEPVPERARVVIYLQPDAIVADVGVHIPGTSGRWVHGAFRSSSAAPRASSGLGHYQAGTPAVTLYEAFVAWRLGVRVGDASEPVGWIRLRTLAHRQALPGADPSLLDLDRLFADVADDLVYYLMSEPVAGDMRALRATGELPVDRVRLTRKVYASLRRHLPEEADARAAAETLVGDWADERGASERAILEAAVEGSQALGPEAPLADILDYGLRVAPLAEGCRRGRADHCYGLALCFDEGVGIAPDPEHAITLYQRGCTLGDLRACRERTARTPVAAPAERGILWPTTR